MRWIASLLPVTKKEKQNDKKRRTFHPMKSKNFKLCLYDTLKKNEK